MHPRAQLFVFLASIYVISLVLFSPESKKGGIIYAGLGAVLAVWFGVEAYALGSMYALLESIYNYSMPLIVASFIFGFIIKVMHYL